MFYFAMSMITFLVIEIHVTKTDFELNEIKYLHISKTFIINVYISASRLIIIYIYIYNIKDLVIIIILKSIDLSFEP